MIKHIFIFLLLAGSITVSGQLPLGIKKYLDRNFRGWQLAGECVGESHNKVLEGDFDGNTQRDYAVKFVSRDKGFMVAFLASGKAYKPFYLHRYSPEEAKKSSMTLFRKGETYEPAGVPRLKTDAPADFRCESDVGGVHAFRNGRFIAY
ncbi:hypothetical protein BH10ACI2_BH10ACI2_16750 [soil metagenome]